VDRKLSDRIKTGVRACLKAQAETGEVPENWLSHLFNLIDLLEQKSQMVTVKMGRFGFCTCLTSRSLCSGCMRIKKNCTCVIRRVNPAALIKEEHAKHMRRIETPMRRGNSSNEEKT
jgi:hypothetical protein